MELKEMIKVMQHYDNGGEVEYSNCKDGCTVECVETDFDDWKITKHPCWNWTDYNYRVKEQKQKVTIEKWLCEYVGCEKLKGSKRFFIIEKVVPFEMAGKKVKLIETYEVEL